MLPLDELRPGMRIKLVDTPEEIGETRNLGGLMDKWCGEVVTVRFVDYSFFTIDEDDGEGPSWQDGHWHWPEEAIDYIVEDEASCPDFNPASKDEILSFIFGN